MKFNFKSLINSLVINFHNLKIRSKLVFSFGFVFIVSILIVIYIFYNNWAYSVKNEAVNYSTLYVKQLNENLNTYVNEIDRLTAMTLADSSVQGILGEDSSKLTDSELRKNVDYMESFLFNMYTLNPDIKTIIVIGEDKNMYVEGNSAYTILNIDQLKYTWYRDAKNSPGGKINIYTDLPEEVIIGSADQERRLSIVRQIRNTENNRFVGCIRIDIPFDKVEEIIKNVGENSSMKLLIMDSNFSPVFDPYEAKNKVSDIDFSSVFSTPEIKMSGTSDVLTKEGNQTLVYDTSNYTNWIVLGIISSADLLLQTEKVRDVSVLIAVITIVVIFIICFIISFGITNPLLKLSSSMKSVQEGNFNVKARLPYSDEIGEIGKSFDIMVTKINTLINEEYLLKIKNREAELKALQAQINPHFLYNTLESLRMKALVNNDREVADMAKKVSMFYRLNIMKKNDLVLISEELQHVRYYMDIQNMRFNNRFNYVEDFADDVMSGAILKLTLQPLVENAIIHGLEPKSGNSVIVLRGIRKENDVFIEIIDNGIGIHEAELEKLNQKLSSSEISDEFGIGLLNVNNRIKFHFGDKYGLRIISSTEKGTKIIIHIPYTALGSDKNA